MRKTLLRSALFRLWKHIGRSQRFEEAAPAAAEGNRRFKPEIDAWISSHFFTVPEETVQFCGNIFSGAKVLNVGCGEMLADFGLLRLRPTSITGLDIAPHPANHIEQVAEKLSRHGLHPEPGYAETLSYVSYDGEQFPFEDETFDVIFSWSSFEHITNVPKVLLEIRRVMKPHSKAFIQVYPWYRHFHGSHLTDWIPEPFFHLKRQNDWVFDHLSKVARENPKDEPFLIGHMWPEYVALNRISARDFYRHILQAGFVVEKARLISHDQDLSEAPPDTDFADLMIGGTMMLLSKAPTNSPVV